ncbi:insulin-like growth factor-binding protein-related protein 1 [Paramacrobiotus metropolitanus]|uniref:insulin-like growth factor-binding protein-related protein 1 n=1 Tax=Paramacrobiotus metropolitanus TaxID=2943436 RepID=UPI0024461A28|nr:insulin-like growth factor-binding protein-related protein 1 [Paramacrobiotus metropolitanus]XP_055353063.1 insulin-like growth factor-binding protein-related protein 1 [Paramacrobiotus metropolitanus]XP_055353064.1 insulin-like growth factor-binding protein-related protein 1 [Paramacrobiotus metropolitanus]XP_055353065.1 insulin-like growth factor-binding protein-related protein 1 [Paramacrobiotus metropolitanus]XP_055353066.1 insulin-like growth factor-binding protein-related protein 1 [Pa
MVWPTVVLAVCLVGGSYVAVHALQCPKCEEAQCAPLVGKQCLAGVVKDSCGCCDVCGNLEGDRCDRAGDNGPTQYGPCGENLQCRHRVDLPEQDAVCICKEQKMICGSNGETYENLCQLLEDAHESEQRIMVDREGPCKGDPWIASAPDDAHIYEGDNTSLACEAMGNPVPTIMWTFVNKDHVEKSLPSDDEHFSVQLRGGPEKFEVTSWLLIQSAKRTDEGNYRCIAKNDLGQKDIHAAVKIYRKGQQIPAEGQIPPPKDSRLHPNLMGTTRARRERRWQSNARHGEL